MTAFNVIPTELSYVIPTELSYVIPTKLSYVIPTQLSYVIPTQLSYVIPTERSDEGSYASWLRSFFVHPNNQQQHRKKQPKILKTSLFVLFKACIVMPL